MTDWMSSTTSETDWTPPRFRLSWGAIAAGAFATTSLAILLAAGAVGLGALPGEGGGRRGLLLLFGALLLATGLGGWVAGRACEGERRRDGALHGALGSAVAMVALLLGVTWWAGGVVRSMVQAAAALGDGAPRGAATLDLSDVRQEARALVEPSLSRRQRDVPPPNSIAVRKADGETSVDALVLRYLAPASPAVAVPSRETVITVLALRAGLSPREAERTIDRWQRTAEERLQTLREQQLLAEQAGREARADARRRTTKAAGWAAWTMIFGLFGALVGGAVGVRSDVTASRVERRASELYVDEAA